MRTMLHKEQRGVALLATLCLFMFLSVMIAATLMGNATQRRFLRLRMDVIRAKINAESGLHEGLHAMAMGRGHGTLNRDIGAGGYDVEWAPEENAPEQRVLRATGISRRTEATAPRKTCRITIR